MAMLSPAGNIAAEVTWSRRDVDIESCWRWCYRGNVSYGAMSLLSHASDGVVEAMALLRQLGCSLMSMPSHAGDDAAESY